MIVFVVSWYDHLFLCLFCMSPLFYNTIISWYLYFYNDIMIFYFLILYILVFVSFAAFVHVFIFFAYDQDVLFTNREYNSGNFYTNPCFCLRIVNNLQNTKYTKYKIFRQLQNTKYKIYFIYWQFFLFGTLQIPFI